MNLTFGIANLFIISFLKKYLAIKDPKNTLNSIIFPSNIDINCHINNGQ